MDRHSHIIQRQTFEVNFSSKERSYELQNKISRLFYNHLIEGMEQLFERVIPDNKFIRLNNITIDIGTVPYDWLDNEFAGAIIEKMEQELLLVLLHDQSVPSERDEKDDESKSETETCLNLLEHFLLTGTLPWWAGGEQLIKPSYALEFLMSNASQHVRDLILKIGQRSYVRVRLVNQFSEQFIKALIKILEPEQADYIFEYHSDVVKIQQEKQLIKSESSTFNKAVWVFILTYLIVDRGGYFNKKDFVKSTLSQMAQHFNSQFSVLLALFAEALKTELSYMKITDSLQTIIFDLAAEENRNNDKSLSDNSIQNKPEAELIISDLDLIRYYLLIGSFPWWSATSGHDQLVQLMSGLITRFPKTIQTLIKNIGKQEQVRIRLVKSFDEELLQNVIKIIEPDNAEFIFDYITEIRRIHTKKALVKVQNKDLTDAVWEFILEYLLVDRGSEFNRQMFLESNIRRLANRFNIKYHQLLIFMVQSISQQHQSSSRHVSLVHVLTGLYNDLHKDPNQEVISELKSSGLLEDDALDKAAIARKVTLKNVIYFWIRFGYLPWWAGEFSGKSPSELIDRLFRESSDDGIILLKQAGLKLFTRRRIVYQLPLELQLRIFSSFPQGDSALSYFNLLRDIIKHTKEVKLKDPSVPQNILLFALWNTFIEGDYKEFRYEEYIRKVIFDWSLWSEISIEELLSKIDSQTNQTTTGALSKELIAKIRREGQLISTADRQHLLSDWAEDQNINQFIDKYIESGTEKNIADEGLAILDYFLLHNKLPDKFKIYGDASVNHFLRQLLLLLIKERPSRLEQVLNSGKYAGEYALRLHEIFTVTNTIEEGNVNKLLATYLERDILLYISQSGSLNYSDQTLIELLDVYLGKPLTAEVAGILKSLLKYAPVSAFLAHYYKNETAYALIENQYIKAGWGTQAFPFLKEFNAWLLDLLPDRLDRDRLDMLFRVFNFMMIGGNPAIGNVKDYLNHFFRFIYERQYELVLKISRILNQTSAGKMKTGQIVSNVLPEIKRELSVYSEYDRRNTEIGKLLSDSDSQALKELIGPDLKEQQAREQNLLKQELAEQKKDDKKEFEKEAINEKDTIYINNAGLVLLHPFLSTYFNRLQMLEKGDFVSEEARHRAVHLLQYLVYGTDTNEEQELVLNKILCNIPVEEPVISGITITEEEKIISRELLNAVLVQWEKLKNTSPESLQTSFLQREGGLVKDEENWTLRVEQRGYDVLLQSLPWGVGMIKTTWMTEIIYVEWM